LKRLSVPKAKKILPAVAIALPGKIPLVESDVLLRTSCHAAKHLIIESRKERQRWA
jgi:hypothetical protein